MVDYSAVEYWNEKFAKSPAPFDWLKPSEEIFPRLEKIIANIPRDERRILHIGSGTSLLSLRMRNLVHAPCLIHNIDFSSSALEAGKQFELQFVNSMLEANQTTSLTTLMNWTQADLRSTRDMYKLLEAIEGSGSFTVIMDKGTSDAMACGPIVQIDAEVFAGQSQGVEEAGHRFSDMGKFKLHPVWLLALHMALLTPPGALWIAVSHKEDRFYFLAPKTAVWDLTGKDVPEELQPNTYWRLQSEELIVDADSAFLTVQDEDGHRAAEGKWLVVMERTDTRFR